MVGLVVAAIVVAPPAAQAAEPWQPHVKAARAYAKTRPGHVGFSVRYRDRVYGHESTVRVRAASLMKPVLLAAYLRRPEVRGRALRADERGMLGPMIRRSDDDAADEVREVVGAEGQLEVARVVGMRDFGLYTGKGLSETSARDQALLFWRLPGIVPRRHRPYALELLRTIAPQQRWGVADVAPSGWRLYFKSGWGKVKKSGPVEHQAALLVRGRRRIALAVTSTGASGASLRESLRGVVARLLKGLRPA